MKSQTSSTPTDAGPQAWHNHQMPQECSADLFYQRVQDLRMDRVVLPKTDTTLRVLFLGDSFGNAFGIEAADGPAIQLEQALNRYFVDRNVEVINRSAGGTNFHHYSTLARQLALPMEADLVIFFLCINDSEIEYLRTDWYPQDQLEPVYWDDDSPLVTHLRMSADEIAPLLKNSEIPVLLFGIGLEKNESMDAVLSDVAEKHGWMYANTFGQFGNRPRVSCLAAPYDPHVNEYVYRVATANICRTLSQGPYHKQANKSIDPVEVFLPLIERLDTIPLTQIGYPNEILRLFDSAGQKIAQMERCLWDDPSGTIDTLHSIRDRLVELYNTYTAYMGVVSEARQQMADYFNPQGMAHEWYEWGRLLDIEAADDMYRNMANDQAMPLPPLSWKPDWPDNWPEAYLNVSAMLPRLEAILDSIEAGASPMPIVWEDVDLDDDLNDAFQHQASRIADFTRQEAHPMLDRQGTYYAILQRAIQRGRTILARYEQHKHLGPDAPLLQAAAFAMHRFMRFAECFEEAHRYTALPTFSMDDTIWRHEPWHTLHHCPHWKLLIEMSSENQVASARIWIESLLPQGFFVKGFRCSDKVETHCITFPLVLDFHIKLIEIGSTKIHGTKLIAMPSGKEVTISDWEELPSASWGSPVTKMYSLSTPCHVNPSEITIDLEQEVRRESEDYIVKEHEVSERGS